MHIFAICIFIWVCVRATGLASHWSLIYDWPNQMQCCDKLRQFFLARKKETAAAADL